MTAMADHEISTDIVLPAGSWDCHVHVIGDPKQYPFDSIAVYSPEHVHTIEDAKKNADRLGMTYTVLTAVSVYGTDNRCLLDALKDLGLHGRAVVQLDPKNVDPDELEKIHSFGVRGVRLNLKSVSSALLERSEFEALLQPYLALVQRMDWVLDLHISMAMVDDLAVITSQSEAKICLDHFGGPNITSEAYGTDRYYLPGFRSMISMLKKKKTWVKLSGVYRLTSAAKTKDQARLLSPLALEILREAPSQCVYGSDWPHTRFEDKIDALALQRMVMDWCAEVGSQKLVDQVFKSNAEELWL